MITTKQRAQLRKLANGIETIVQIGKGGMASTIVDQMSEALTARELVKGRVLETSPITSREAAVELAERCSAEVVQVIGTRFVLYKHNPKNPKIKLI